MKTFSRSKFFVAVLAITLFAAIALAAVLPISIFSDYGWWTSRLVSTAGSTNDTGLAVFLYYTLADSKAFGLHFIGGSTTTGTGDTSIAQWGVTIPYVLSGGVNSSGVATRYIQRSDTARITLTTTSFSDSTKAANGATTWSSSLTGGSGTATDSFSYLSTFSTSLFMWDTNPSSNVGMLETNSELVVYKGAVNTARTLRLVAGNNNAADSVRITIIRPNGKIHDTYTVRTSSGTSETFTPPATWTFDSGISSVFVAYWDAGQQRLQFKSADVYVDVSEAGLTGGTGVAVGEGVTSSISQVSLTVNSVGLPGAGVQAVRINGVANAPGANSAADQFLTVDSNTSGFDTRLPNSIFAVTVFDSNFNPLTKLPSGQTYLMVVNYNFSTIPSAAANAAKLLHYNGSSNSWDVVANSTADSANRRIVAYVSEFSNFAIGNVSSGSTASEVRSDNCVVNGAVAGTGLAGIMPSLRSVRDTIHSLAIGRWITSCYYDVTFGLYLALSILLGVFTVAHKYRAPTAAPSCGKIQQP